MPSRPRRTRKKRRKIWDPHKDWSPGLWGALGLNLLLGLTLSPVTALQRVRVVGAAGYDQARIRRILGTLLGRPSLRTDRDQVQSAMLENLAVEDADFRTNLFGRGVLRLSYKRPVAALAGQDRTYLSSRGAAFSCPDAPVLHISVEPPVAVGAVNLAAFGAWRSGLAARMCENISGRLPDRVWRLVVSNSGFVTLVPDAGGTVEFGSFDDMDRKIQALDKALSDNPALLAHVRVLNLLSPDAPVVRR